MGLAVEPEHAARPKTANVADITRYTKVAALPPRIRVATEMLS